MRRSLVVVAVAAGLLAAGCGRSKHDAVAAYINRVDKVEKSLAGPLAQVTRANQTFAHSQSKPQVEAELAASGRTMRKLRRELAVVESPPEAKQLRALLLQLVDREVALAQEVAQLGSFVPNFAAALHPLAAADAALKAALAQTAKGTAATKALDAQKATALETYASTLESVIGNIRALHPPPVWEPGYAAQLSALGQLRSSGLALAQAIRANRAGAIPTLLHRFDLAAVADQSVAVQEREIAAVKAYDTRITELRSLARKIELERVRLQRAYK